MTPVRQAARIGIATVLQFSPELSSRIETGHVSSDRSGFAGTVSGLGSDAVKRSTDVAIASVALLLLSPVLLAISAVLRVSGSPVTYQSMRIGQNGRRFGMIKFRTMVPDADRRLEQLLANDPAAAERWQSESKVQNDPRITRLGRFLRRTSLDELPQLINVLRGDMSIVGPRPILPKDAGKYGEGLREYCSVRPGLTGVWQTNGRSLLDYPTRVAMDLWYVQNRSMWLDLRIMLRTIPVVLGTRGAW